MEEEVEAPYNPFVPEKIIPEPELVSFSADGQILLKWNVKMRMSPQENQFSIRIGRSLAIKEQKEEIAIVDMIYEQNSDP